MKDLRIIIFCADDNVPSKVLKVIIAHGEDDEYGNDIPDQARSGEDFLEIPTCKLVNAGPHPTTPLVPWSLDIRTNTFVN